MLSHKNSPMVNGETPSTLLAARIVKFKKRREERARCKAGLIAFVLRHASDRPLEVWIRDISEQGIGFTVAKELVVGEQVTVKLKKNTVVSSIQLEVVVVHCTEESERCWHVGCEFKEPLTELLVEYLAR